MPYVNVPNDLSKIKTKIAFNLTKRQLICFGGAAVVGIPVYLLTRSTLGNTGSMFLMITLMLPAFFMAMYERDGLPFEKVVRNILRAKFTRPGVRPYQTQNIYAPFAGKEDAFDQKPKENRRNMEDRDKRNDQEIPSHAFRPRLTDDGKKNGNRHRDIQNKRRKIRRAFFSKPSDLADKVSDKDQGK